MSNIKIFENPEFGSIRTVDVNNEPWFVGKDVCEALRYSNSRKALADHIKENHKGVTFCDTLGGKQRITIIDEAGLYSLVMRAKTEKAEAFQEWVTSEVLPAIRKHGGYLTADKIEQALTDPDTIIKLATTLKEERAARQQAEASLKAAQPKMLFADAVSASDSTILIGDLAKILKQNGHPIGQKRLFCWMRETGYLIKRQGADYNSPTQRAMELGLFKIKETAITHADGHVSVSKTTKVTGKGQEYFINKFCGA
ncbi:phage antirepressor [Phascolarctobacterium sp.]|uniref:phage antirepressor n=1 Tax=Phascolarctobacterium sp. TaxID=2049039 RepID=UPI003F7E68BF